MSLLSNINLISIFLIGLFLAPIVAGLFRPLTSSRIFYTFATVIELIVFTVSAALSVVLTNAIFSEDASAFLISLIQYIPGMYTSVTEGDVFVYALLMLAFLIIINSVLHLITYPFMKKVLAPLSLGLERLIGASNRVVRRLVSGIWQLPRSVLIVLVFALLFNFYVTVSKNASFETYINSSQAYRFIDEGAIKPLLTSEVAQQIPPMIDGMVDKAVESLSPEGRKLFIKTYINGVTVNEAVRSSPDIDNMAIDLVDVESDKVKKAEIIYDWIVDSISYDHDKVDMLETDAFALQSGAVTAFAEKTGVCFDKACLFVAMCRAVGVRVRLLTGLAYNGAAWMDHSWNQIYDENQQCWLNVDPTFGRKDNSYFNSDGFYNDHKEEEVHGEW